MELMPFFLTDEKYFGGSFERLTELTIETKLPVLCKDFIIDKIQIDVAAGACQYSFRYGIKRVI